MFSISAVEGKFKRSNLELNQTFLFDEHKSKVDSSVFNQFENDERCIIYYVESKDYSWYITNKHFLIPSEDKKINLTDLKRVDFINLKENPDIKLKNRELNLFTDKMSFNFVVEEGSWHLFYDIFKFIIANNNSAK